MKGLYTNRSSMKDFVKNGFDEFSAEGMDVFIAAAFFTEFDVIESLLKKNCHIRIVVRLGFPTSPFALEKLLNKNNIEARFYTSHSFHPKLYIFGEDVLFLGSANLTSAAILTNQEVMIGLSPDDPRFDELTNLFSEYWDEAEVLTSGAISSYKVAYEKYKDISRRIEDFDQEVTKILGDRSFPNIGRVVERKTKKSVFLDMYRKSYQESVAAFKKIEDLYSRKPRKVAEDIPVRTEIDSFFSFVRERYATEDFWSLQPIGWNDASKLLLDGHINDWLKTDWPHFEDTIVNDNYPLIKKVFGNEESIATTSPENIVDALCVLHSFHDRRRYFSGGLETLKEEFLASNSLERIVETFTHLLYGHGDTVSRMADCLFDGYKLNHFGKSNVQELVGWVNKEELPVVNSRTTKVLRYFGFDVVQL